MKKILITGKDSYIGTSFETFAKACGYEVDTVDMIDGSWREKSFSDYDAVFHVAGIAHRKETDQNRELYFQVNRDLAIETAKKAKKDGVGQFVFLSTMSVYGMESGVITRETAPAPKNAYGFSKLEAEEEIKPLSDEAFRVCVIRPPMVYGKDCKGNFQTVIKLVKKLPVFPRVKNKRSMIHVDNLSRFVLLCIDRELSGVYLPQNKEYVNTTDMAKKIADALGKKLFFSRVLGFGAKLLTPAVSMARKAFSSLVYENCEDFEFCYCQDESIEKSV